MNARKTAVEVSSALGLHLVVFQSLAWQTFSQEYTSAVYDPLAGNPDSSISVPPRRMILLESVSQLPDGKVAPGP